MKPAAQKKEDTAKRLRITVRGAVQGVGFRPFVYRLATELGLLGWVNNSPQGVFIEVQGPPDLLRSFLLRLPDEKPPRSFIQSMESTYLDSAGYIDFQIRPSDGGGEKTALVLPDIATCQECLADIFDPENRRYRYPFTNCTNCGPRYSIIEALPYDRPHTSMKIFDMCEACRAEYEDPLDRRFHAQPNACPVCGPHIELWDRSGSARSSDDEALFAAAKAIKNGKIIAVKGLGGFHLMADARNDNVVRELRKRKHREEKPLAIMVPTLEAVDEICEVSYLERRLLKSPEAPIVLLRARTRASALSDYIAPGNPYLGVMLPYSPLHHLLMKKIGFPVIATSGNLSDEPICIDEHEAVNRLTGIADRFLIHNRPIVRHVDDSIVRVVMGRETVLRRARGFAPLPVTIGSEITPTLAVGAHLKNTVAVASGRQVFVSQHIGDLETREAFDAFSRVIDSVETLYEVKPTTVAFDRHPDYLSTKWALRSGLRAVPVQHHYAHVLSCMAENDVAPPVLGIAWDGTGFGTDGTIWGGEFLRINTSGFERTAHLRTFRLPGGDLAVREPRRSAIGVLYELFGDAVLERRDLLPVIAFMPGELKLIREMLEKRINAPVTSSAGRLFDAVASILGLRERIRFEGQAAMELEFFSDENERGAYEVSLNLQDEGPAIVDWGPMIRGIFEDTADGIRPSRIAAKFHNTLVEMMVRVAHLAGDESVVLSGGCFQNKVLTERSVTRLLGEGFKVYWHQRIPTNDGGIALGQAAAAARDVRNGG
jgi:hydrogenase maturation protein HypF